MTTLDRLLALPGRWLDRVTMYRLVTCYLIALLGIAVVESGLGVLDYPVTALLGTTLVAVGTCWAVNVLFARTFQSPVNHDSAVITGLILALIVGPAQLPEEYAFLAWASILAIASKYILAVHQIHLFNPAAIAVVITGLFADQAGSWWVGTASLTPFVIGGGLVLVRKLRRGDLVLSFVWTTLFVGLAWSALTHVPFDQSFQQAVLNTPIWFLAFAMLTEPVTMPSTKALQVAYGALAGLLVLPQVHLGTFYPSPEFALVTANAAAYVVRPRQRRRLRLDRAVMVGPGLMDFLFVPAKPLAYRPGQYMEWTMDHGHADGRGKRRFFTLASSPTERSLRIGVKFADASSTFKRSLAASALGTSIVAAQVGGDFTLPRNTDQKLAFIAGGIGVTPFRSMVKYLTDRREPRDIVMLYANRHVEEILYWDVFQAAQWVFRFRPVLVLSDASSVPPGWGGAVGRIDAALIARQIPDYRERLFYVSGSPEMVRSVQRALGDLGVTERQIRTDYFSGLAS